MAIRHRTPFAPEFNFVVLRPFIFNGRDYAVGDDFDKANVNERVLRKLYDSRNINAVIPSFTLKKDHGEAEPEVDAAQKLEPVATVASSAAAKPKGRRKSSPQPKEEPTPSPPRFRIDENFGVYRIYDGDKLLRECTSLDEAKAAMAELAED